ncbi:MAG: alpha/beta hydrolase family esterase [Kofleriaceae bacterium]
MTRRLSVLVLLGACGEVVTMPVTEEFPAIPAEAGTHELGFLHDGVARKFIVHVPASYDAAVPRPLLVVLHGGGGSAKGMFSAHPLAEYSERSGYIFVAAQGSPLDDGGNGWNGSRAFDVGIDDVGYLERLFVNLPNELAIDTKRRWLAGFSGGATMTVRFATERSELIAAAATFAGKVGRSETEMPPFLFPPAPTSPLSVQMTYGTEDDNYLGEVQGGSRSTSAKEGMLWWAGALGCNTNVNSAISGDLTYDTYPDCNEGVVVRMITVRGMGHIYPDKADGLDGTKLLLDFFEDKVKN